MNKKSQRIYAGILAVVVSVAMVGSAFVGYFLSKDSPPANSGSSSTANIEADYQNQKASINAMVKQAEETPDNVSLLKALADAYYNAGMTSQIIAPAETQDNFKKAVEAYQKVLKTNQDPNIIVDMATSAFYSGNYDLAEQSYKQALDMKPDFLTALFNYGVFLSQAKNDWAGALIQWQKALPLAQTDSEKEQIQALISQAQSKVNANQSTNGVSNPNLKNAD
ncbi:tetratricopeptide repeat protein [Desulfosporosinus orientis DSM 765]|uniref:Tetratricopeptide repeat protein n=1 Tax=Desulfosporosinus orientis (strain ATCC 19365 / DSM 765 / NCIMB 8382 / VKM B-1628 / Singapore I) TaxID=768706 RepID=G7WHM1_DESOD|nr:tetratricopeptide repeat protein [Desulfosporosinus orientis]AET70942.1 tetratricopeptide repeat protein [Desulfosporosinus orientis DSM 765]